MTFPPGWLRLATRPLPTGSSVLAITIGIVSVAFFAARLAGPVPVTITSTGSCISSCTSRGRLESSGDIRGSTSSVSPST